MANRCQKRIHHLWRSPMVALGFKISWPKSFLEPNTRRVYMGFVRTRHHRSNPGQDPRVHHSCCSSPTKPLRSPLGWKRPKWAWDFLVVPADLTVCTLTFLWFHVKQNTGRFYLRPDDVQVIATDASKSSKFTGWGVAMDQNNELITLGARFEDEQTSFSIATLELMAFINAIPLALENGLLKPGHPLQPLIDNMVALSCVKRGSSSNQLLDSLARVSVMLLHRHDMESYDPLYIPSKLNPAGIPSTGCVNDGNSKKFLQKMGHDKILPPPLQDPLERTTRLSLISLCAAFDLWCSKKGYCSRTCCESS